MEAATRIEMVDQTVIQRKVAIGLAALSYKRLGQGPWRSGYPKRPRGEKGQEMEAFKPQHLEVLVEYALIADEVDMLQRRVIRN